MGFWDNLKSGAANMNKSLQRSVGKFKNSTFADASMAVCALVAAADGSIDADERRKVAGFIATSDTLSVFDVDDLQARFNGFCDKLNQDYDFGKISVLQTIGKLRGKDAAARACIQVGIVIGGADGDFDDDEKQVLREACRSLGLAPGDFDL